MRSLQGGEHRLTKLGKGFFRDKYYEYLVHVPVIIRQAAQRAERGLRAQGLAAGEREAHGAPHGGAGGAAGQATSGGLAGPGRPHPAALGPTSSTLRGTGWSAPRARVVSRDGKVTSRGTLCTEPSSCNTNHVERCIRTMPL